MGPHPGVAWIRETRPQMAPPWRAVQQKYTGCVLSSDGVLQRWLLRSRVNLADSKLQSPGSNHVFTYCRPRSAASCAAAFG